MLLDLTDAPELIAPINQLIGSGLPEFITWDSPGNWRWHRIYDLFPADQVVTLDRDRRLLGAANGVPLRWAGDPATLPDGFDDVLTAVVDRDAARDATVTCLLSISLAPEHRGQGLVVTLLDEHRRRATARGYTGIIAPLRPTSKHHYPLIPIAEYARWRDPAGEPFDPWLRTHIRAGGRVIGLAERSLVVRQPVSRWEQMIGRAMPQPGRYLVPGALTPIERDESGFATYVEPNIWVLHPVSPEQRSTGVATLPPWQ